ncbi:hypothetical protein A2U01_0087841 [Trifolium medium]|uniref:Uncharacterized protein n=1 Tax=Trifolium medium TaxID=97028 RepID=A0A392TZH1_9FABA|nr:hypothetical protein [Trifolium medium]
MLNIEKLQEGVLETSATEQWCSRQNDSGNVVIGTVATTVIGTWIMVVRKREENEGVVKEDVIR